MKLYCGHKALETISFLIFVMVCDFNTPTFWTENGFSGIYLLIFVIKSVTLNVRTFWTQKGFKYLPLLISVTKFAVICGDYVLQLSSLLMFVICGSWHKWYQLRPLSDACPTKTGTWEQQGLQVKWWVKLNIIYWALWWILN